MLNDLDDTEETELADGRCARKTDMKVRLRSSKIRSNYEFLRGKVGVIRSSDNRGNIEFIYWDFSPAKRPIRRRNTHFLCRIPAVAES